MALNPAIISALAAVAGSTVGSIVPVVTTYLTQRSQLQREVFNRHIEQREALYAEFIAQASKLYAHSIGHSLESLDEIVSLYALTDRIRLLASQAVYQASEQIVLRIVRQYGEPNLKPEEIRELALNAKAHPLDEFSLACRSEFEQIMQHGGILRDLEA